MLRSIGHARNLQTLSWIPGGVIWLLNPEKKSTNTNKYIIRKSAEIHWNLWLYRRYCRKRCLLTCGMDDCVGTVLCIAGCFTAPLAFAHTPVVTTKKCLQMLPNKSWMHPVWEPLLKSHLTWIYPISHGQYFAWSIFKLRFSIPQSPKPIFFLCYTLFNSWWSLGKGMKEIKTRKSL